MATSVAISESTQDVFCSNEVPESPEVLLNLVYHRLRGLARAKVRRLGQGMTLTATEVVHEAYLRISQDPAATFANRRHFIFAASRAMQDLLVEALRRKAALKRGGDLRRVELGDIEIDMTRTSEEVLDLDRALRRMEQDRPELAGLLRLRFFGGFQEKQIAEALGLSRATVQRRWLQARAWLRRELAVVATSPQPAQS